MDGVAQLDHGERQLLFQQVAAKRGLLDTVIEKDFWVCWILKHLFNLPESHPALLFKGGTSLSKVHNLIWRFSEDVDLSVDRAGLGHPEPDDFASLGSNARNRYLQQLDEACRDYVGGTLLPPLTEEFSKELGDGPGGDWGLSQEREDGSDLVFEYPTSSGREDTQDSYLITPVKLELGARSDHWPNSMEAVHPYAAEEFPEYFQRPECAVRVINAERTFWDKAMILHREYHRLKNRSEISAFRCSRHYYDLAMLCQSWVRAKALADVALQEEVVTHQRSFFNRSWANFNQARKGTFRLVPQEALSNELEKDYRGMRDYFFQEPPSFDEIVAELEALEKEINAV